MIAAARVTVAVAVLGLGCSRMLSLQDRGTSAESDAGTIGISTSDGGPAEICNGVDDDGDGVVDNGCACNDGDVMECGERLGDCVPGVQRCRNGKWGACEDQSPEVKRVRPTSESCDGHDNDCDGDIDEGCDCREGTSRGCDGGLGVCHLGQQTCVGGSWGACVPTQPAHPEICDGLDNDCNGMVDEGFDLAVPCDSMGRCPQSRACSADHVTSRCVDDPRLFTDEDCDGIDNDCDGLVDRVVDGGMVRSVCQCQDRTLAIGMATDKSIGGGLNLCAATLCSPDKPRGLLVDGHCYPSCLTNSDPDGDGFGFENGASCLVETSPRGMAAPPCDGIPLGMAITYCLDCNVTDALPYAMCQSVPQFDLSAFGKGQLWLSVDYTFTASGPAGMPVNLWFESDNGPRKHLPLVRVGDIPGHYQALLRAEDACFNHPEALGSACSASAKPCAHCGSDEVCGALAECGDYDLSHARLQVAAEFCDRNSGQHRGTVTINHVDVVEPNCQN